LDVTTFWKENWKESGWVPITGKEEVEYVAALVKFFVLEWSQPLDYQLYHDLPTELFLG